MPPERLKTDGRRFWDANPCGGVWSSYAEALQWLQSQVPYAYRVVNKYDWTDKLVLDVGCGQGFMLNYLAQWASAVGLDMSTESLRRAATSARETGHARHISLSIADAECLPFAGACFDVVLSMGVLHHTPDTRRGIGEIHRVMKTGGLTIVMLYRSGNPKWWATRFVRACSRAMGGGQSPADVLCSGHGLNDVRGTALLELFGVPVLKAFSNREAREMFKDFSQVNISNHEPGLRRMVDIVPALRPFEMPLSWFDRQLAAPWGFYQVIEARK